MRLRAAYASQGVGRALCAEQGRAGGAAPSRTVSTPCPRGGTGAGTGWLLPPGPRRSHSPLGRWRPWRAQRGAERSPPPPREPGERGAGTGADTGLPPPGIRPGWEGPRRRHSGPGRRGCAAAHRACGRRAGAGVCSRLGARSSPDRHLRPPRESRRALPCKLFPAPQRNRLATRATWARDLGLLFAPEHHCAATWNLCPREQVAVTSGPRRWPGTRQGSGDASEPRSWLSACPGTDPGPGFRSLIRRPSRPVSPRGAA